MTKRKKKGKDGRRRKEMAAYREMIRRIRKGEVQRLRDKRSRSTGSGQAGAALPVVVLGDHIYTVEKKLGQEYKRIVTPGALARCFEEASAESHWSSE